MSKDSDDLTSILDLEHWGRRKNSRGKFHHYTPGRMKATCGYNNPAPCAPESPTSISQCCSHCLLKLWESYESPKEPDFVGGINDLVSMMIERVVEGALSIVIPQIEQQLVIGRKLDQIMLHGKNSRAWKVKRIKQSCKA